MQFMPNKAFQTDKVLPIEKWTPSTTKPEVSNAEDSWTEEDCAYSNEFKIKAVRLTFIEGAQVQEVAAALDIQYRVIYRVVREKVLVQVVSVTPHDYRSK